MITITRSFRFQSLSVLMISFLSLTLIAGSAIAQLTPDYEMQRRFQPDWRNPASITLPNTPEYAQPQDFLVMLKLDSAPVQGTTYTWNLTKGPSSVTATGANPTVRLTAGDWSTTVTEKVGNSVVRSATIMVNVKDTLIVAIGDSYGSGEGCPEIPAEFKVDDTYLGRYNFEKLVAADLNTLGFVDFPAVYDFSPVVPEMWARSTDANMTLESRLAHRSTHAYSARYAMAVEEADPHSSVTYVSVAQSGAVVSELINTRNTSADDGVTLMPVQLEELKRIVGNRKIDTLLISIGGNDVGFGPLLGKLLNSPVAFAGPGQPTENFLDPVSLVPRYAANAVNPTGLFDWRPNALKNVINGNFTANNAEGIASDIFSYLNNNLPTDPVSALWFTLAFNGISGELVKLSNSYTRLNQYLSDNFNIGRIAITEYPDINRVNVRGSDGKPVPWWGPGVTDLAPGATVNPSEGLLATKLFAEPLNRTVSDSAAINNWLYVGGVSDVFAGHGYGAPKDTRWIVTARESLIREGSTPEWFGQVLPITSFGMAHQSSPGLVATARLLASKLGDSSSLGYLAADVTFNGATIGSSTDSTPLYLGRGARINSVLITETAGSNLGYKVEVNGGFSILSGSSGVLPPGGSANFVIQNPTDGSPGVRTGTVTITFTNPGVPSYSFLVNAINNGIGVIAVTGDKWMARFSGDLPISRLTLPGTHDTMALYETIYGSAKCQTLTLGEQLNKGVRCLDIRGRHIKNSLAMHHGIVFQKANFSDVVNTASAFLKQNPSETIVMLLQPEWKDEGNTRSYEATVKDYISRYPSNLFYTNSSIPKLKDVRGKIVLVRRFSGSIGIDATSWPDNPASVVKVGPYVMAEDLYKLEFWKDRDITGFYDRKWSLVYDAMIKASEDIKGEYLRLSYSSAIIMYTAFLPQLRGVANDINPRLNAFFEKQPFGSFGAVMMDFATPGLIEKIYRSNDLLLKPN
jgi:1-phosphatidylinositol phosphodiesterase